MKQILVSICVLIVAAGCTKEIDRDIEDNIIERTFIASYSELTKTSLEDGHRVNWVNNDIISYYSTNNGLVKNYQTSSSGHSIPFKAEIGENDSFIIAVYGGKISNPMGKSMTLSGVIKDKQSGKFEDAHVSLCKHYLSNGDKLSFHNVTSLISFSLQRDDIKYIDFVALDKTQIHGGGTLNFTFDGESYTANYGKAERNYAIKVNTNGSGTFYLSTLPCSIKGFEIRFYNKNDICVGIVESNKTLTLGEECLVDLGVLDSRIKSATKDLSATGTSNCYIASIPGQSYKFNATVKGNSTELVGVPHRAEVLWESFGTDVTPNDGEVINNVQYKDGYIYFNAGKNGNALIALYDIDSDLVWSWHIWVCEDYNPTEYDQIYNNDAGIMMDRNLGATSATPGTVGALGLFYQWGRKDPFLGSSSIRNNNKAASTITWPSPTYSNSLTGTVEYSISHPMTFIYNSGGDWIYSNSDNINTNLWSSIKSMYDPCPSGYRVPYEGYHVGVWYQALGGPIESYKGLWSSSYLGMDFINYFTSNEQCWYPASGYVSDNNGLIVSVGYSGYYWSCNKYSFTWAHSLYFEPAYYIPGSDNHPAMGMSVRCIRE